jgi:NAD(P)H-dependent FMN reductase
VPVLRIIIASTRPGRVGLPVGSWFTDVARAHGGFDVEVTDLAELNLPFMDEPKHPRFREYTHDHTRAWSEAVDAADAFVFVMPEYNFGINAPLKNAIDFLHQEWHDKPVGFVSYGGVAAGTRAVQMTKQIVSALKMLPVYEAVYIPFVASRIEDGRFHPSDVTEKAAGALLDELLRVEAGLRTLRAAVPAS